MSGAQASRGIANDERWMARALQLAAQGEGLTRPNPPVGAVVVRNGRVVGEGWHHRAGAAHAEVIALQRAGAAARGATLYVTLEPCCTWGRQPPCTDAILRSGVKRLVAAICDPNPRHRGRGLRLIARAGVDVLEGVGREAALELIAPFACWVRRGRPYVTLKLAATLDGRIADEAGVSRWITGAAARREVHRLRRRADVILIGRETAVRDDPSLLPRPARGREVWRVVVARRGDLPLHLRLLNDEAVQRTLIAVTDRCPAECEQTLRARGAEVLRCPEAEGGVDLHALFNELGRRGFLHVLCEGGGTLAGSLVRAGLVDALEYFVAPGVLGATGKAAIGGGWLLEHMPRFEWIDLRPVGRDLWLRARRGSVRPQTSEPRR